MLATASTQAETCEVKFDLNYKTTQKMPETLQAAAGHVLPLTAKPRPERDGYRFAGWYTSPQCKDGEEWLFGVKQVAFFPPVIGDSMAVNKSMTLYARWEEPVHITDAEGLRNIRNNMHGWYVLDNDIVLPAETPWQPIGRYDHSYEYCDAEWWTTAFKGIIDGQGHAICNLYLTQGEESEIVGMFGALANGTICNLTMDNTRIDFNTPAGYAAPLIGIAKEGEGGKVEIRNCQIINTQLTACLTSDESLYCALTGMVAGIWNGTIIDCKASGTIDVEIAGTAKGDFYIGGIVGEGYSNTRNTSVHFDIRTDLPAEGKANTYIGLLQASGTYINGCKAEGSVTVNGKYTPDMGRPSESNQQVVIGGVVGSERYDSIQHCESKMALTLRCVPSVQYGGVAGEFNKQFGAIGPMVGITRTCILDCTSTLQVDSLNVGRAVTGEICGSGQPEPVQSWGNTMGYEIKDCTTKQSDVPTYNLKRRALFVPEKAKEENFHLSADNMYDPYVKVYLPEKEKADGRGVIIFPGGGYAMVAYGHEGMSWAPFFNDLGIAVFVVKYDLPFGDRERTFASVRQTMEIIRDHAKAWGIDLKKVGVMGSSAGGHLASTTATHDLGPIKPAFQILFYPVITMDPSYTHQGSRENLLGMNPTSELTDLFSNDKQVTADTPPAIIFVSEDDDVVPVQNTLDYYNALQQHGIRSELHTFPTGGHGWGYRKRFKFHKEVTDALTKFLTE